MARTDCVYLNAVREGKTIDESQVYGCNIYEECITDKLSSSMRSCIDCPDYLPKGSTEFASQFKDPLNITDRRGVKTNVLRGMLSGSPTFLVCGGPSANELDLSLLCQRGIWSMAVNNMAGHFHASSFVCSDPPSKFHSGIWLDPTMMKFIPTPKLRGSRGHLRTKLGDGTFKNLEKGGKQIWTRDCPNVWAFERRSWHTSDDAFFLETSAAWGNHSAGVIRTGGKKTVCTMLLALRLLYYLGSRTIFLVGVDFQMDPTAELKENYAFGEERDLAAIKSNNDQFSVVGGWLSEMENKGVFKRFGLQIFNCNPRSGLRAFGHLSYNDAIAWALDGFPREPFDVVGWYKK